MGLRADTEGDRSPEQWSDPGGDPGGARLGKPTLPTSGRPPADLYSPSLVPTVARPHQRPGARANAPGRASCTRARARAIGSPQPQPSRPTPADKVRPPPDPRQPPLPPRCPGVVPRGAQFRPRVPPRRRRATGFETPAVGAVLSRAGA